jgi:hypothetical protein
MRLEGHVACMEMKRNACRVLLGKPEEERLLRKPRHRWKHDIKMELKEIG